MLNKTANILAIAAIFVGPLVVVLLRYENERTVTTESGMGFMGNLFVVLVVLSAIFFLLSNFKAKLRNQPFSTLAIGTYGLLLLGLLYISYTTIKTITESARANLEVFVENMAYHYTTMLMMIVSISVGLLILLIKFLMEIKKGA